MRALILKQLNISEIRKKNEVVVTDKATVFHLLKVVRIKLDEKVLILNGLGLKAYGVISNIDKSVPSKSSITISIDGIEETPNQDKLHLAICLPKKDAMEEIFRIAQEIGISKIIPIASEYSLQSFKYSDRISKIIESAAIQSNNPCLMQLDSTLSLQKLKDVCSNYDHVVYFSSVDNSKSISNITYKAAKKILMIIGPEGGLSSSEEIYLNEVPNLVEIHLPTYILRTTTAVAVASGFILSY